ncbi:hypothetical protein CHARACLAT_005505 [Characodon lateralis]|uniref:Uncharacterized protein n=1 Tax=Characodon lateralis TaxID=208331 RepID=A0ABU7CNX9_9TELE|nr:hypothetical protein [Characodon lateralis]
MKFETIHSFIFYVAYSTVGHGGAGAYLQLSTGERRGKPAQVASPSQGNTGTYRTNNRAHTHSHLRAILETNLPKCHIFGLWEEAGVPGENPRMHGENMQTPCRKSPGRNSNPGPSCCKETVLPADFAL